LIENCKLKIENSAKRLCSNKEGGILLWVISVSSFVILVFFSISVLTRRNIKTVYENIESISAFFSAEGDAEEGIIRAITKNDPNSLIAQELVGGKITNYTEKIKKFLDRKNTTEYWMSEKQENQDGDLSKIKEIEISWNYNGRVEESFGLIENADLSIMIAKWPKNDPYNLTTGYIYFEAEDSLVLNGNFEDKLGNDFNYWKGSGGVIASDDSHKDKSAAEISSGENIYQDFSGLETGETYYLKLYAKGKIEGGTQVDDSFVLHVCEENPYGGTCTEMLADGSGGKEQKTYNAIETNFYKEYYETFVSLNDYASVYIESIAGTLILDNVKVSLEPKSSEYSETRIIKDGGEYFDMEDNDYVLFIKTGRDSTHFEIKPYGRESENKVEVNFPDKVLQSEITVNSSKADLKKTIKINKELYRDGNSDFPYSENLLY